MVQVDLIDLELKDVDRLRQLVNEPLVHCSLIRSGSYEDYYPLGHVQKNDLTNEVVQHFVAKKTVTKEIVGGATLESNEFCYFVNPNLWNQGWGGAIAEAALLIIRKYEFGPVFLTIERNNIASIKIAEKLGFKFFGFHDQKKCCWASWLKYVHRL